jgi:hypothetical protein
VCRNPVVGGDWLVGADSIAVQKKRARRALLAREWFYLYGPPDAPPLPLSGIEQDDLRYHDALGHLVAEVARSLEANDWDFLRHPSFDDFARGALASEHSPEFTREHAALCERFAPRLLRGLGPGQIWQKPAGDKPGRSLS